jgi:hypothetical protein
MKTLNNRGFSAIEGLLILVIIGIVAGTGYYVLNAQKKSNPTTSSSSSSQTTTQKPNKPEAATKTAAFDSSYPFKLHFTYPENWTITESHDNTTLPFKSGANAGQNYVLKSPSGKYNVKLSVSNGGLGGACEAEDPENGKITSINRTPLNKFSNASFTEETSTRGQTGNLSFSSTLNDTKQVESAKVGSSICDTAFSTIITLDEAENFHLIYTRIEIQGINDSPGVTLTQKQIDDAIKTDEYKQAVSILKSVVFEK